MHTKNNFLGQLRLRKSEHYKQTDVTENITTPHLLEVIILSPARLRLLTVRHLRN